MSDYGGINDAVLLLNLIKGGTVRFNNKLFGSTGSANSGSETTLSSADEWAYVCTLFFNLQDHGITRLRTGIHDWQGTEVALNAGSAVVSEKCLLILDAAKLYGVKVTIVLGGFSDSSTAFKGANLFVKDSILYSKFVDYASAVADALKDSEIELLELVNEPDYIAVKWADLNTFIEWETNLIADVRAKQSKPGVPLGMGTAVDSSIYPMDWWGEISGQKKVIDSILKPCDVLSVHTYIGDSSSNARKVWLEQKVPAFRAAAKRLGKKLIIGETGLLYNGGTYDEGMSAALSDIPHCWMVRKHNPTIFTIPTIPTRPSNEEPTPTSEPTPDPPIVEEPEPPAVEPPVIEEPPVVVTPPTTPTPKKSFWSWFVGFFRRKMG